MPCCCFWTVSTGTVGIVEKLGQFEKIANPGLNVFCWPLSQGVGLRSTRVQQLDVQTDTKTKDNVTVSLKIAVQYRVINELVRDDPPPAPKAGDPTPDMVDREEDPCTKHGVWRAYYRLTDIQRQLTPYVEDVVRSTVPRKTLDEAYEAKEEVAVAVKTALSHEMKRYGYEIVNALVTDLQPDARVLQAMNQIESQRRMRMAAQEKAEAEKILVVKAAEADAESKFLSGQGVARQRKAIVEGLKDSVVEFNEGVRGTSPADVMQLMMVTQYLDMMKDVGTKDGASTVFIPHMPGAVADVQNQMRQGFLEANAATFSHGAAMGPSA